MNRQVRTRVLGKFLHQFADKEVIVAGNITNVSPSGNCVDFLTLDNVRINIMSDPKLTTNKCKFDTEALYEVWGTAEPEGTMMASQFVKFDKKHCKDFDPQSYNDLMMILHVTGETKWQLNENKQPL